MPERSCYRVTTAVFVGAWHRKPDTALEDAIKMKLAVRDESGSLAWRVKGSIERSICRPDSPCLGIYPPD